MHHTGHLNMNFMVQRWQWRKHHDDAHYAAALYHYEWEFAVKFHNFSCFSSLDDKHKVGNHTALLQRVNMAEGFSLVVERLLKYQTTLRYIWFMVPSQVNVKLKKGTFEPSSPLCHSAELANLLHDLSQFG